MAKEKDPAFLFYSKDWLQGTAGLMPDEKGVYIDLLAHQHQNGKLTSDTKRLARLVGLGQADFDAIWATLKDKFSISEDNHMVNLKLTKVVTERSTKAHTKAISAKFATLIRTIQHVPEGIRDKMKKDFKVADYECFDIDTAYSRITIWFSEWLTRHLGNGTAIGNGNNNILEGQVIFNIEDYLAKHQIEFEACLSIKPGTTAITGKEILKKYHLWLQREQKYPKSPLALIAGFQSWILNEKNHVNGTAYKPSNSSSTPVVKNVSERGTRDF